MSKKLLVLALEAVGWESQFQVKKDRYKLSFRKDVARNLTLRKGAPSFGYLTRCVQTNRSMLIYFPDGNACDGKPLEG